MDSALTVATAHCPGYAKWEPVLYVAWRKGGRIKAAVRWERGEEEVY